MIALKKNIINLLYIASLSILFCNLYSCQKEVKNIDFHDRSQLFTDNWMFFQNDTVHKLTDALNSKSWDSIDVPHDWSIYNHFDKKSPAGVGGGALSGGIGYYKKTFFVPHKDSTRLYKIQFDGIYQNSEVWINGNYLGKRPNGYIGFEYDLTPYLSYGSSENIIVVKADNSDQPNSRWYSGSGIYRNVWLKKLNKIHVPQWGTFVTTPLVSKEKATIKLNAEIKNEFSKDQEISAQMIIFQDSVEIGKSTPSKLHISANSELQIEKKITLENPEFWSVDTPNLYIARLEIIQNDEIIDRYDTQFGIRDFEFDLEKGFILNGESLKYNPHDFTLPRL